MTDLEITKACAEMMGLNYGVGYRSFNLATMEPVGPEQILVGSETFDPLHDDAQAMALVKKFHMGIDRGRPDGDYHAASILKDGVVYTATSRVSLNAAICECVANMHNAKLKETV